MDRATGQIHDAGNHGALEQYSDGQAGRFGQLTMPAGPAGERDGAAALTPRNGTRSCRLSRLSECAGPELLLLYVGAGGSVRAGPGAAGIAGRRWIVDTAYRRGAV